MVQTADKKLSNNAENNIAVVSAGSRYRHRTREQNSFKTISRYLLDE